MNTSKKTTQNINFSNPDTVRRLAALNNALQEYPIEEIARMSASVAAANDFVEAVKAVEEAKITGEYDEYKIIDMYQCYEELEKYVGRKEAAKLFPVLLKRGRDKARQTDPFRYVVSM